MYLVSKVAEKEKNCARRNKEVCSQGTLGSTVKKHDGYDRKRNSEDRFAYLDADKKECLVSDSEQASGIVSKLAAKQVQIPISM